jgi:putative heme-binding domain-containing protein
LAALANRQDIPLPSRTNIFGLLSSVSQKRPPWNGEWWSTQPVNGSDAPKTVKWEGTAIVASALRSAIADREPLIRKIGVEWVHSSHDTNSAAELVNLFQRETDASVRASILKDLAGMPGKQSTTIIASVLQDPHAPVELLVAAIEAASKMEGSQWNSNFFTLAEKTKEDRVLVALFSYFGDKKLATTVPLLTSNLSRPNPSVRQHAVDALKGIGNKAAIDGLASCLTNSNADLRRQVIVALGTMKAKSELPALIRAASAPETHDAAVEALVNMPDVAALDFFLEGIGSKNAGLRSKCETALRAIQKPALPLIEARLATNDLPAVANTSLKQIYLNDPEAKKDSVFRHKILENAPTQFQDFALAHSGDAKRGKTLFHDLKGVGCIRCHRIEGEGGDIGPDLTGIRAKYPRSFIIESVLYPSKQIMDGYQQVFFETKDDDDVSGIVRSENPDEVTVMDSGGIQHVLKKTNIKSRKVSQISLMPEGLQGGLSLTEFSDLISYIENPVIADSKPAPTTSTATVAASEPIPEPGSDLFSFLDVPAPSVKPDYHKPDVLGPPSTVPRPNPGPYPQHSLTKPPPPPLPKPVPQPAVDSSADAEKPSLPPMPPGFNQPPPKPDE